MKMLGFIEINYIVGYEIEKAARIRQEISNYLHANLIKVLVIPKQRPYESIGYWQSS